MIEKVPDSGTCSNKERCKLSRYTPAIFDQISWSDTEKKEEYIMEHKLYHRILVFLLISSLSLTLLSSCHKAKPEVEGELVLASIYPYQMLLNELLSPELSVASIIPPNASPHTWNPNPSDLVNLEKASLILVNGLGLENSLQSGLDQHRDKLLRVEDLLAIDAYEDDHPQATENEAVHGHETAEHHHHEGPDPHIWISLNNMISLTRTITPQLQSKFPALSDSIAARSDRLIQSLESAYNQISLEASALQGKGIITYHNSFGLFLSENGMEVLATVQSSPGTEPSAREMGELGRIIRQNNVKAIFVEPQMSRRSAEVLAHEFQLKILSLDPLGSSLNTDNLAGYYLANWAAIRQAFE